MVTSSETSKGPTTVRKIIRAITRVDARIRYAVLYVLFLLAFAGIYDFLPGENFYHSNVSREPMLNRAKKRISEHLKEEIIATYQDAYKSDELRLDNWRGDAKAFKVNSFDAVPDTENGSEVKVKLNIRLTDISQPSRRRSIDLDVTFPVDDDYSVRSGNDKSLLKTVEVNVPELPDWDTKKGNLLAETIFPARRPNWPSKPGDATGEVQTESLPKLFMPVSEKLDIEIQDFSQGLQGDPSKLEGHFWRMLYLSSVTITTLGFGDIAPLTRLSRCCILIEAVIGIIVIGLFIGACTKEPASRLMANSQASRQPKGSSEES